MSRSTPAHDDECAVSLGARGRSVLLSIITAIALIAAAATLPANALAGQTRTQVSTFDGSGADAGAFQAGLGRVAVNQASGSVYVSDDYPSGSDGRVDKFDALGVAQEYSALGSSSLRESDVPPPDGPADFVFLADSDVAVDNSGSASDGNLVALSENQRTAWVFDSSGVYLHRITGFGDPCGVAVDSGGNVWVSDYNTQTVSQFDAAGAPTGVSVSTAGQGAPCHIAFDSNDDLYVAMWSGAVWKYAAVGGYTFPTLIDSSTTSSVTVNRTNHQVYVVHSDRVSVYDAVGVRLYDFADANPGSQLIGVAVNEANDQVYVSDGGVSAPANLVRVFGAVVFLPDAATDDASDLSSTGATLNGIVDPQGVAVTDCFFEYGTDNSYGQTVPCVETAGSGTSGVSVHADVSGLDPLQAYHFRLVAGNANGTTRGLDTTFLTPIAPQVESQSVGEVSESEVTLRARLIPNGAATSYHFEYGTTVFYGASVPVPDASVGSGLGVVAATQAVAGLQPATTYHFRVVATNSQGTTPGPDGTFTTYSTGAPTEQSCPNAELRTGHGATLPDCRAYEQVTPVNKNGNAPDVGNVGSIQASENGDAITFLAPGGIPGGVGAQDYQSFLARRGADSWSTAGMFPPPAYGQSAAVLGWTRDMATVFDRAGDLNAGTFTLLARNSADGSTETAVPHTPSAQRFAFAGASRDGAKVYFEAIGALTPEAIPGVDNLYVWDRPTGTISLAGVLPDDTTPPGGSFAGPYRFIYGSDLITLGGAQANSFLQANHAVSDDGSVVFFTAAGTGQLYLRKDATAPSAATVQLSASRKTNGAGPGGSDPNGPQPAVFRAATSDASMVLFTSPEELTNDAHTGTADQGNDLYTYDLASDELTDLTPDAGDPNGADVRGVIGMSDDGSYVYFAANGVLADGATPGDCTGNLPQDLAGACNMYLWHDGNTSFITRTSVDALGGIPSDATNWQTVASPSTGDEQPTGRVTPDGRTLLFRSKLRFTDYDNSSGCNSGARPCGELYRYRVGEPGLTCVSCNPSGAAPTGDASLQSYYHPSGCCGAARTRNLSADGDRVFFESVDALVPGDTNGVRDVYLWQAGGSGSCQGSAANGGCLYLLSTGKSTYPSYFADASVSAADAFFFTDSQLVPGDRDGIRDIYTARVGGGLAGQHPVVQTPCSGEACKAPPAVAPTSRVAGSVSFDGDGNETARARTVVSVSKLKVVTGSVAKLRVKVARAGRISVSGASVKTARRSVSRAATYTIAVRLSAKAKRALKHDKALRVAVRVAFAPRTGPAASKKLTLSFKQPKRGQKGGH